MSKIEAQWVESLDLRIARVTQAVTLHELVDFRASQFQRKPPRNLIWIFAPGSLKLLSMEDMKSLLVISPEARKARAGGRTVVVGTDKSEQVLLRWYKEFSQTLGVKEVKMYTATSLEEARLIIEEGEAQRHADRSQVAARAGMRR